MTDINYKSSLESLTHGDKYQQLFEAHVKWQEYVRNAENKKTKFNPEWLKNNGYEGLYNWMLENGVGKIISKADSSVKVDFEIKKTKKHTFESVVKEIQGAHAKWLTLSAKDKKIKFNINWLLNNGFSDIYKWIVRQNNLVPVIKGAGNEVAMDFMFPKESTKWNKDLVLQKIKDLHKIWKSKDKNKGIKFNTKWIIDQGGDGAYSWIKKNGGLDLLIKNIGEEIENDFEKKVPKYDNNSAVLKLKSIYEQWNKTDKNKKIKFNTSWIQSNCNGLYHWMYKNGGVKFFVDAIGGNLAKDFEERQITERDLNSVIEEFRSAHELWKTKKDGKPFNTRWIIENGYSGFYSWALKNGGIDFFSNAVGGDVEKDFEKRKFYTVELAISELSEAYEKWKSIPIPERGSFNSYWLIKNSYHGLRDWAHENGGLKDLVKKIGGDLEKDFEENNKYTFESALEDLNAAHSKWKTSYQTTVFNSTWLKENGFGGLYNFMLKNGGVEIFVNKSSDELKIDYKNRANIEVENNNKKNAKEIIEEISEGQSENSQQFRSLISLLGASHAIDILYKFHPEFKGVSVGYLKSCLADYLGDFLVTQNEFKYKDIKIVVEHLSDLKFREGLYEAMKGDCLRYYFEQRRAGIHQDGYAIINSYLDHMVEEVSAFSDKFLDDVIQNVVLYFDSALKDFKKPEKFVDRLSKGREFPDINQRINMKELQDKKRMLIADDMGLGKSASVIMAKEQLHIGCALVIAPSNVLDTWSTYLSDNQEKKGYFKKGEAPRVLKVENSKQLDGISKDDYDYILISQERITKRYANLLSKIDPQMMIIDEAHKIKNPKGERTKEILPLAKAMEGEGKYLALLSGTPIPNKIKDLAVVLKLLYPDKFSEMSDRELVSNIIYGDVVDLRSLLIPHMQMKSLKEVVEMPELREQQIEFDLSAIEKQIYEVLMEEDELSATDKMRILRQFLLNPEIIDSTPGIESTKLKTLELELKNAFANKSKVVLFVNDYVEGVIRGEKNILEKLKLPDGVEIRVIHGEDPNKEKYRQDIQTEFNNGADKKILLVVSGSTADVGVSFTGGEEVIFYNEPWMESQRLQELARVYRPGLEHSLESKTLIAKLTIEEGIHAYIKKKHQVVEKILKGVPITELEQQLLVKDEKAEDPKREVNPELAEYFFSSWDKLMQFYGYVKFIGEEKFLEFLQKYGEDYAQAYKNLGSRSYQANTNRVSGTLIGEMVRLSKDDPSKIKILDVASGPEMLRKHIGDDLQESVNSLDINPHHFDNSPTNKVVGSWSKMPFEDSSFDYLNSAMSLHYSAFAPSKDKFERVDVLKEMNRVLKDGGRAVVSIIYSLKLKDLEKFQKFAEVLGFKIVDGFSGEAETGGNFKAQIITLEKVKSVDKSVKEILSEVGKENFDGLKFDSTKTKLKDARKVAKVFTLDKKGFVVDLNQKDTKVAEEEQSLLKQGEELKAKFKRIKDIPSEEVLANGFVRILIKEKFVLFKKLKTAPGVVIIR